MREIREITVKDVLVKSQECLLFSIHGSRSVKIRGRKTFSIY